jgi:hypothetical protein
VDSEKKHAKSWFIYELFQATGNPEKDIAAAPHDAEPFL